MKQQTKFVRDLVLSTALVTLATLITTNVEPIRVGIPFALFFAVIGFTSWYCGRRCGLWSIGLSLIATSIWVFDPVGEFAVKPKNLLQLAVLGTVATVLNLLIAALQSARDVIHRERETLRTTLLSIGDAVIATNADGNVWFMNKQAEELTGWTSADAANRPVTDVFKIVNEYTRALVPNPIQKVLETGQIVGLANHTIVISRNGTETAIEDSAAPIRNAEGGVLGVVMVFHDVTEKRHAERQLKDAHDQLERRVQQRTQELRESEEKIRLLIDSVVDYAIYSLDVNGNITSWNSGAKRIKGYDPDEVIGKHFSIFFPPEDVAAGKPKSLIDDAVKLGRVQSEGWRRRKDGTRFWGEAILTALKDETGTIIGFAKVTRDLTLQRQAEETRQRLFKTEVARDEAERAERRITGILNTITDGFIALDSNWNIVFVNPEAEKTIGPRASVLGKNHWDYFAAARGTIIEHEYKRARNEGTPVEFETFYEPYSKWFSVKAYPTADGLSVFFRDITAQKHAEAALKAESERLRVTLTSIGDAVIVTDTAARVTMLNPIAETLTGWTSNDAYGKPMDEVFNIVNEYTRARAENPAKRALREGTIVGLANHTVLISRTGAETPIDDSAAPIKDEEGHVLGVVLVFRDITEKKKAEAERAELLKREREARRSAEHANRLKDEFLAIVSHELRTPLTPILGWASMLKAPSMTKDNVNKGLEIIERNVAVQKKVIEDLLDVSRIISGKLHLDFKPLELNAVIEQALETIKPTAQVKGITIEADLDRLGTFVNGDSARLQQAIWNLLGNALKFTPKGGRVFVGVAHVDSRAEVTITDTGEGIDSAFLPSLFARFSQADSSTTRVHGGLGLGLAIVKHVVEAHGGTIVAESQGKGKGATFKIRLPIAPIQWRLETTRPPAPLKPPPSIEGLKILVVDDEPDSRDLIAAALSGAGAQIMTAANVADALDLLAHHKLDLIISDIGMPHEDGYSLIRKVRQRSPDKAGTIPAIAVTAFAKPEDRIAALAAGFQAHVSKPMEPDELLHIIAATVQQQ